MDINSTLQKMSDRLKKLEQRVNSSRIKDAGGGYWMSMGTYKSTPVQPFTASAEPYLQVIPRAGTLKKVVFAFYINDATNNSTNYWRFRFNSGAGDYIDMTSVGYATTNWNVSEHTSFLISADFSTAHKYFYFYLTMVGTPSGLLVATPSFFFI